MSPLIRAFALAATIITTLCAAAPAPASAACFWGCTYTKTRYPIVLAHGAIGFQSAFGVIDYWYGAVEALESGGATVFTTSVSSFHSSEARGEELLAQIEDILAITGAEKVNLIGHAQGGLDVRYVAAVAPSLVASVTTIGAPHTGSAPFDLLSSVLGPPDGGDMPALDLTNSVLAAAYTLLTGDAHEIDLRESAWALSYAGAADFNAAYPAGMPSTWCGQGAATANGIRMYSWSGTALLTNMLDPTDLLFAPLAALTPFEETEGFTTRCSSHFGQVIRDNYYLNHLDAVNNAFGLRSAWAPDPASLLRAHANRLKGAGL